MDFIAEQDRALLTEHGLADFDALWALQLEAVDEPNTERGGWSSVYRLELGERAYYLKRQSNHLTRSLLHPLGEPTFAREFRNIQRYQQLGIPALRAAFFAQRRVAGEQRAILLTQALDGWSDLYSLFQGWSERAPELRHDITVACGLLARQLHAAGQVHGCFYPKHIFLQSAVQGQKACLIDLEKTRPKWLGERDQIKDLETLFRRADPWTEQDACVFLQSYLNLPANAPQVQTWLQRLTRRRREKEARA